MTTETGSTRRVEVTRDETGVALVVLQPGTPANCWSPELERDYQDALAECRDDPSVRVVVVTAAGRWFSAGGCLDTLEELVASGEQPRPKDFQQLLSPLAIDKPVVAAINGACVGRAVLEVLQCDVRFASEEAFFSTGFVRRGLTPDGATAWLLTRTVGVGAALDLLLSGRRVGAAEAQRLGIVTSVVPGDRLRESALEYARDIAANCSPSALAATKAAVYAAADAALAASLEQSYRLSTAAMAGPDFAEGVASLLERRPARFGAPAAARRTEGL